LAGILRTLQTIKDKPILSSRGSLRQTACGSVILFVSVLLVPLLLPQVQAYNLAIEQHRNFELRVPANVSMPNSYFAQAEALLHSSTGSFGKPGSMDGMPALTAGAQQQQQPPSKQAYSDWGSFCGTAAGSDTQQQAAACNGAKQPSADANSQLAAVVAAATAAAVERSQPPHGEHQARRRSIGGMRYIRFQFRSVSSVGSHMAPAVSVPPALVSMDRTNYYWGTVDIPASSVHGEHMMEMGGGYTFGPAQGSKGVSTGGGVWLRAGHLCTGYMWLEPCVIAASKNGTAPAQTVFRTDRGWIVKVSIRRDKCLHWGFTGPVLYICVL
jgi:hypothetical protein